MNKITLVAAFIFAHSVSHAASRHVTQPIIFKNGVARIEDQIKGHEYVDYKFIANAGEPGFRREVQLPQAKRISTRLPSSARIAWKGVR